MPLSKSRRVVCQDSSKHTQKDELLELVASSLRSNWCGFLVGTSSLASRVQPTFSSKVTLQAVTERLDLLLSLADRFVVLSP